MNLVDLITCDYFKNVKCDFFLDPESERIRVRPLKGQMVPANIFIECSRKERERHSLGTKFLAEEVKVCIKPTGRKYLRAKTQ